MEQSLQHIVARHGPLEFAAAARYVQDACRSLAAIDLPRGYHGSIRPETLVVDSHGRASILPPPEVQEEEDSLLSMVDYLAPECALSFPGPDLRSDIYSLGCTLYFLLADHLPFPTGTVRDKLLAHQVEMPQRLAHVRRDTPEELAAICEKMLAKRPASRYQSLSEVDQALEAWLNSTA